MEKDNRNLQGQKKECDEKDRYGITYEGDFFSCSSTDCTGLIPAGIVSEAERESYKELYPSMTPTTVSRGKKTEEQEKGKNTR